MPKPLIAILAALATIGLTIVYSASTDGLNNLIFLPHVTRQYVEAVEPSPTSLEGQVAALATRVATLEAQTAALSLLLTPTPTPVPTATLTPTPTATPIPATIDRFMAMEPDMAWWKAYGAPPPDCRNPGWNCYTWTSPTSNEVLADIAGWIGKALLEEESGKPIPSPDSVFLLDQRSKIRLSYAEKSTIGSWTTGSSGYRFLVDSANARIVYLMARLNEWDETRTSADSWMDEYITYDYNYRLALRSDPQLRWFNYVRDHNHGW